MTRLVAIDHGTRRIGVAVGDSETGLAFTRPAIRHTRRDADLREVEALCATEAASLLVVGLPLNMDGSEGPQARAARAFGDALRERGLRVVYEDERLSSWQAERGMREAGRRATRSSGELDSAAARLILQQYLDARRGPRHGEESE